MLSFLQFPLPPFPTTADSPREQGRKSRAGPSGELRQPSTQLLSSGHIQLTGSLQLESERGWPPPNSSRPGTRTCAEHLFRRWNEFPPSRDKAVGSLSLASVISYFSPSTYPLRSRLLGSLGFSCLQASGTCCSFPGRPSPSSTRRVPGPRPEPISSVTSSLSHSHPTRNTH